MWSIFKPTSVAGIGIVTVVRAQGSILVKVVHLGSQVVGQQAGLGLHAVDGIVKVVIGGSTRINRVLHLCYLPLQIGHTPAKVEQDTAYDANEEKH